MSGNYTTFPMYNIKPLTEALKNVEKDLRIIKEDLKEAEMVGNQLEAISHIHHSISLRVLREDFKETIQTALN